MELTDLDGTITFLAGLAIAIGIVGVIVPVLPGLVVSWLGVLVWVLFAADGPGRWVALALASAVFLAASIAKYAWPGRNLKTVGVPNRSIVIGGLLGIVGFFVVPVVGLPLGFVLGIFLAERVRLADGSRAWTSTKHALNAVGLSMLIELAAALAIAAIWIVALVAS